MREGPPMGVRVTHSWGRPEEWLARVLVEQLPASLGPARRRSRWPWRLSSAPTVHLHVGGTNSRADVVVAPTPDPDSAIRYLHQFPKSRLVVLHPEILEAMDCEPAGRVLWRRFLLPDWAYDAAGGRFVFETAARLRLESRPRLVYAGDLSDGRGITRAFHVAEHALVPGQGELVIPGGQLHRAEWAPVLHRRGLAEQVVLAPLLSQEEYAGVLHGADVLIAPEDPRRYPVEVLMAAAAGVPIVALDQPLHRLASGDGALLVRSDRDDAWPAAVMEALVNGRRRERMIQLGRNHADESRLSAALASWQELLAPLANPEERTYGRA